MSCLLELEHVRKQYGGVAAVKDVSLAVDEGSITAIIGPNGAGKTTLFNTVTGFEPLDAGKIRLNERRIERMQPWQIAQLGLVRSFQTPTGFPALTVSENLMVAGSDVRNESLARALFGGWRTDEALTQSETKDLLQDLGVWHLRNTPLVDLPPGDVKLIDFGRLLMTRPKVVLLDEPASGVDPKSIGNLAGLIKGLKDDGVTVLVIDHNIGFVLEIADHVMVMATGEKVAEGSPGEIAQDERVIEIYLGRKA